MRIFIKTLQGTKMEMDLDPDMTIKEVKEVLEQKQGMTQNGIHLIYKGKRIVDSFKISYYNIQPDDTLYQALVFPGG